MPADATQLVWCGPGAFGCDRLPPFHHFPSTGAAQSPVRPFTRNTKITKATRPARVTNTPAMPLHSTPELPTAALGWHTLTEKYLENRLDETPVSYRPSSAVLTASMNGHPLWNASA